MSEEPIVIRTVQGQLEAQMIQILLEGAGIPAALSQESAGLTYGLTVGPLGAVDILVQASREAEALEVLDAYDRGMPSDDLPAQDIHSNDDEGGTGSSS